MIQNLKKKIQQQTQKSKRKNNGPPGDETLLFGKKITGADKAQLANKMEEVGTWHRINGMYWRPLDPYDKVMKRKTYGWSSAWTSSGASMPDKHIMCQMN